MSNYSKSQPYLIVYLFCYPLNIQNRCAILNRLNVWISINGKRVS